MYYSVANSELIQIMSRTATKWNGIKVILNSLNILRTDTIYFGNCNYDVEPIQKCSTDIDVSNAVKAVLDAYAIFIISKSEEHRIVLLCGLYGLLRAETLMKYIYSVESDFCRAFYFTM